MTKEDGVTCIIFCDSVKNPITGPCKSTSYVCAPHMSQLTLEVKGATSIDMAVEGCIATIGSTSVDLTDNECEWSSLACIKSDTLEASTGITENGIYYISAQGINRLRVNLKSASGSIIVIGEGVR